MWSFKKLKFKKKAPPESAKRGLGNVWSYYPNARFGIFRRVLLAFMIITIIPVLVLGVYTLKIINSAGDEIVTRTTTTLNRKTRDALELQAVLTAQSLSDFLKRCETDLLYLKEMPRRPDVYVTFSRQNKGEIWIRTGTNKNPGQLHKFIPLYREVAFIDARGNEKIKIINNRIARVAELKNVRDPQNTTYRCEHYFEAARRLPDGGIYVSHLNGFYVTRREQLRGEERIETAIEGKRYQGVIRFATPVYEKGRFAGVLELALDHRHLMEFTQHILPLQKQRIVFPDYYSGNYAFMFDDEGWIITHPKYWDIRGVDSRGRLVPAYTSLTSARDLKIGRMPFNLDSAGFIHENYPFVARQVRKRQSGSVVTTNVGGITKIMAYAPILYDSGSYKKYGIFGGITIGAEIQSFHLPAYFIGNSIRYALQSVRQNLIWMVAALLLISLIVSWFFSRGITKPVLAIMSAAREIAFGAPGKAIQVNRRDEIGVLAMVFNFMSYELKKSRKALLNSYNQLKKSKTETENYARDLEYQIKIFKSIQRISNILGSTFDMNRVIKLILQNCVEGVGFDRAILYLLDEQGEYLECKETHGFTAEGETYARRSRYHLQHFDCIETRVAREGRIIFVEDFSRYKAATELDKKIRKYGRSNAFVFVPLKVKEKIIGILGADKLRSAKAISELDINSLQILANQASRVIENTRLYQEVMRQRNFVQDVFRNMINGVITVNSEGRITSSNRAARQILAADKRDLNGLNVWKLFGSNRRGMEEIRQRLQQRGVYHGYNLKFQSGDEIKYLTINASLMKRDHPESGESIIIIEDVTEKKYLDEHLQRMERLASLGRFAAGIAHEIRNPLTGVSLFLDDLHDSIADKPEIARLITMALSEIERLENLTQEVLNYANPDRGAYRMTDLNELIQSTLQFVDKQCRQSGIKVQVAFDERLPELYLNPEKIRQALLNIFLNSIQVMPEGGRLVVQTRFLKDYFIFQVFEDLNESRPDTWAEISVSDSGPGISAEEAEKIFEPFYSKNKEGTGLGLSTTQSIISEHHGQIEVSGNPDGGATFTIYLPVLQKNEIVTLGEHTDDRQKHTHRG